MNSVESFRFSLVVSILGFVCAAIFLVMPAYASDITGEEGAGVLLAKEEMADETPIANGSSGNSSTSVNENHSAVSGDKEEDADIAKNGSESKNDSSALKRSDNSLSLVEKDRQEKKSPQDTSEIELAAQGGGSNYESTHTNIYRLYNPTSGEHFYTSNLNEAASITSIGWRYEGIGWVAPLKGAPVFRLFNPNSSDHHYTLSTNERNALRRLGWIYEGVGWYSDPNKGIAVLRQFNPNEQIGTHNFTVSKNEDVGLGKIGWKREGIAWYASNGPSLKIRGRWIVSPSWGGRERYWLASDGTIAKNRFITPGEGAGYYAYAKSSGAVVRGKYKLNGSYTFVADNAGRLASTPDGKDGWIVTKAYDGGWQRYYYVASQRAMRTGLFTVAGSNYYGLSGAGYVMRGKARYGDVMLLADNGGVLDKTSGWLVTKKYDGGWQRYWLVQVKNAKGFMGAKIGLFTVGKSKYYGTPQQGYVARNQYVNSGRWYRANNDGVLTPSAAPEEAAMLLRAQGFSSATGRLVLVDTKNCKFGVFRGSRGNWVTERFESCVCGASGSPTIKGTYSLGYHLPVLPAWSNALYCTNITGGYFFHSVLSSTSELGQHLSHGCVRLNWPTAQYVQSLPYGSTVNLY